MIDIKIKIINYKLEDVCHHNYDYDYFHATFWIQVLDCNFLGSKDDISWFFTRSVKMAQSRTRCIALQNRKNSNWEPRRLNFILPALLGANWVPWTNRFISLCL
jgi:hypothetical protein